LKTYVWTRWKENEHTIKVGLCLIASNSLKVQNILHLFRRLWF